LTQFDTPATEKDKTYTVAQGDTLQSIADKFNITTDTLMSLNNLKTGNYLYAGKVLTVTQIIGANGQPLSATNMSNQTASADTSDTNNVGDAYGNQQAPVVVQDERDGVKQFVATDDTDTDSSSINVQNDYSSDDSNDNSGSENNSSVTVQDGDTIDSIASQAGTTVDNIRQLNNLNSDLLVVGQSLLV